MPKTGERRIATMVKISTDTYNKLHYLKEPFETHDETLNRVLGEYPDMSKKVKMLEEMLVKRGGEITA